MRRRDRRLVPVAEFADVITADEAWSILDAAGIAASVVTDPAVLGAAAVTRVYVHSIDAAQAQQLLGALVRDVSGDDRPDQ